MKKSLIKIFFVVFIFLCMVFGVSCSGERLSDSPGQNTGSIKEDEVMTEGRSDRAEYNAEITSDTLPTGTGNVMVGNVGDFEFDPSEIVTVRDDLFNKGYFSIFDILVHLDRNGEIDMVYHFDDSMNTYVIDSLNGIEDLWYIAYYDGGWPERNVFRMDHYPYKENMYISISEINKNQLQDYYSVFSAEVTRKEENKGKVIVPRVIIKTPSEGTMVFEDVELKPHDLRDDMFKKGTITAIDAVMTLGDKGEITYGLNWYESVGTAKTVKNFFVDRINGDSAFNRCGYVYEAGSLQFEGFSGNHIHLPSDSRIINSPEYIEFYWICI